jgi:RNase P protein component
LPRLISKEVEDAMTREEIKRSIREAIPQFLLKRETEGRRQKAKGKRQKLT